MDVVLQALGDASRRTMLEILRDHPATVTELADAVPIARPGVSRHLRVLREAGLAEYSDEVVNRPDIQDAIRKIDYTVYSDEEAEAKGYTLLTTFLDVTLKDGRRFSARTDAARGSASLPLSEAEVADKFRGCARFARWLADRAEKAIALVLDLENVSDIRKLTALLRSVGEAPAEERADGQTG